jgi:phosphopantetheine adenylyltransferase/dephospho-CoA kinase
MLAKTGLLIVSNPKQIGKILPSVQKKVQHTLYIQLLSALTEPFGNFHTNVFNSWPKYSQTIYGIYSQAVAHCQNLDVRVLLSGLKYQSVNQIQTKRNIDLVIFDKNHKKIDIDNFIKNKIGSMAEKYGVITLDSGKFENFDSLSSNDKIYKHAVLGGTFDRLHTAHKLLLSEAALRSDSTITVGVTEESMLPGKTLWELIENLDVRMENVKHFLSDICTELVYHIVPISDPFGPSIHDPTMEMIVVSEETLRGGEKINEIREKEKKLNKLDIIPVKLIDEPYPHPHEEMKISSSTARIRMLGTLLKPVEEKAIPKKPYIIGLTGGVASGKSGVAKWLSQLGAEIVNCDLIAHDVYKRGKPCHSQIVEHFGESVLTAEGEIDRKVLGPIVFKNPEQMKKLNSLVWPAIAEEVVKIIGESRNRVLVVEAAVLLTAGWEKNCHEVWSTLVPREEAIKRLISRNGLTEEQAISRIDSQPGNKTYVDSANVVLCPLWEVEFTKKQVEKAWNLLQGRLL